MLLEVLPYACQDFRVALKGGTAINLFLRNMPRLSVDIDLVYLPLEDRKKTFKNIHSILNEIKMNLEREMNFSVTSSHPLGSDKEVKLFVRRSNVEIKIEPNFTIRGTLFGPVKKDACALVYSEFRKELQIQCVALPDVFGGKLVAALDRQHPRDFFDVKYLLDHEGITSEIKEAFLFYLISHNRPLHEVLDPNAQDIRERFENEFHGMAQQDVAIQELEAIRDTLPDHLRSVLTENDKEFLVSFFDSDPKWDLFKDVSEYPSVKWKLLNQKKMDSKRKSLQRKQLNKALGLQD